MFSKLKSVFSNKSTTSVVVPKIAVADQNDSVSPVEFREGESKQSYSVV